MKMRFKIAASLLICCFSISLIPYLSVSAYTLPNAFWGMDANYQAAVSADDYAGTIKYGNQELDLILKEPSNETTQSIISSRSYKVAFAYFLINDYENASEYFNMYIPYGKLRGEDDGVIIAQRCANQFTSRLEVYKGDNSPPPRLGARNEPDGVLFGQTSETTRSGDSMVLTYIEYGDENIFSWIKKIMGETLSRGAAMELALNFPNEGSTARSISASDHYISDLYSMLSEYKNLPIYLRIGAEFNTWDNKCTPEEYIPAYRAIASRMRSLDNVATVWSMVSTSTWKNPSWPYEAKDFYPGDEYVDWIGVSCYPKKYFQATTYEGRKKYIEVCYNTGDAADPVFLVEEAVSIAGGRKPVMLSECGSGYRTNGSVCDTDEAWAAKRLKEMYTFIPMVYPEVKLIAYFNKRMESETVHYDLDGAPTLRAAYDDVTRSEWFIHDFYNNTASLSFEKQSDTISTNGDVVLYSYPHIYGAGSVTVTYYIDGEWKHATSEMPYKADFRGLSGTHKLTVTAKGDNGVKKTREYTLVAKAQAGYGGFYDVSGLTAAQDAALRYVVDNGIMSGYDNEYFGTNNTMTRAEFATVISRMMGYESSGKCAFADAKDHWASGYIKACVDAGAINGIDSNTFAPDSEITFEQAIKILTIVFGYADDRIEYPKGFINIADAIGVTANVSNKSVGSQLKRMDAAMIISNIMSL